MKNSLNPAEQRFCRPGGHSNRCGPQDMVRLEQVKHVHDAQGLRESVGQEVDINGLPPRVRDLIPVSPDGLIEALVQQGKPADQSNRGASQKG